MKRTSLIYFIGIIVLFYCCNRIENKSEAKNSQTIALHNNCSCNECKPLNTSLEAKSIEELHELNIQITQRYRKSFRSWNYNEPDRWVYLSKSFADEVISSNPQFVQKSTEISKLFVENLTKRAEIYYSDAKNKKSLMEQASNEFKYNLCYVIGVEGFNSWQKNSREIYQEFSQTRDSLKLILAIETEKRKTSKTQKP